MRLLLSIKPAKFLAVLVLIFSLARAQEPENPGAIIHRIAESSGSKTVLIEGETERVQLQREETPEWQNAKPGLELTPGDRLKLEPYMHVDLQISGFQEGQIIALPNPPDRGGTFRIQEDPESEGKGFVIALESGSMSIDWVRQKLTVIAYSIRTLISGTKVAFIRDPETNKRILFLDHGAVSFPDYPEITMEPGDIAILEPGPAPVVVKITPHKQAWLRGIIRYNADDIWKISPAIPLYRKPIFYIPAAAILIGGGTYFILKDNGKDETLPGPPALPE